MSTTPGSDGVSAAATALAQEVSNSLSAFIDDVVANVNQDTIANAQASAAAAAASATAAASSASSASQAATTSASNSGSAGQSATWASKSATAAASSAAEALSSQQAANTSYTNTQAALAAFNSTATALTNFMHVYNTYFLGASPTDPTQDGNGQPVSNGAMYENTQSNKIRVYNGTQWNDIDYTIAAQLTAATAAATAAANSATAAATSATNAGNSATLAQDWASQANGNVNGTSSLSAYQYAQAAASSGTSAAASATAAAASATEASNSATQAQTSASTASSQATNASASAVAASNSATAASTSASNADTSATASANSATAAAGSASAASTSATNAAGSATAAANSASTIGAYGVLSGLVEVTNNTNLTGSGYGKMYQVPKGSAGGYTIAVPTPVTADAGKCVGIMNQSSGAVTLTISAGDFYTSFGSGVQSITVPPNSTVILQTDGTNMNGIAGTGGLGMALTPTNAVQPGQWEALTPQSGQSGSTFVLPGDNTQQWAYFVANGATQAAGVAAGGAGVLGPFTANNPIGFAWRVG